MPQSTIVKVKPEGKMSLAPVSSLSSSSNTSNTSNTTTAANSNNNNSSSSNNNNIINNNRSPVNTDTPSKDKEKKDKKKAESGGGKWRRRVGFLGLCLAVVMSSAVFSLLAPFYPDVAADNGLGEGMVGFVFAIFALMVMIISPYLGVKMGEIGSRKMMIYGLGLLSVSTMLFSMLASINSVHSSVFLGISIVLRVLQGIGAAGSETASYALAAQLYPDDLSYSVGVMETMCSFGYMIGPPLGGLLFQLGGFSAPFLVVGAAALTTTGLLHALFPRAAVPADGEEEESSHTFTELFATLRNPGIAIVASMAVVANGSYALLEPTLEPFVKETFEDFNQAEVGLLFFVISLVYAAACPLSGWAASRNKNLKLGPEFVMLLGMGIIAVAMFLVGPSPLIPTRPVLWVLVIALMLLGLGQSMASVPNMDSMLGFCDDPTSTKNVNSISGILNAAYSLGGIIGPVVGSMATTAIGFPWATTGWGFLIVAQCSFMIWALGKKRGSRSLEAEVNDEDGVFNAEVGGGDGAFGDDSDSESDTP